MHDLDIFISGGIFGAARPASILNALYLSSSAAIFSLYSMKKVSIKPLVNFLGRNYFPTEVLDNRSDLKFIHFANVSHPPLLKVLHIYYHVVADYITL